MKTIRVPRGQYAVWHYRKVKVVDTVHTGGSVGLNETTVLCETHFPYSHCTCGEYQVQWGM